MHADDHHHSHGHEHSHNEHQHKDVEKEKDVVGVYENAAFDKIDLKDEKAKEDVITVSSDDSSSIHSHQEKNIFRKKDPSENPYFWGK